MKEGFVDEIVGYVTKESAVECVECSEIDGGGEGVLASEEDALGLTCVTCGRTLGEVLLTLTAPQTAGRA